MRLLRLRSYLQIMVMTLVMMRRVLLVGSPGMPVERAQLSDERRN